MFLHRLHSSHEQVSYFNSTPKVRPNQLWQGQDHTHSLIILACLKVFPYLIGNGSQVNFFVIKVPNSVRYDCFALFIESELRNVFFISLLLFYFKFHGLNNNLCLLYLLFVIQVFARNN